MEGDDTYCAVVARCRPALCGPKGADGQEAWGGGNGDQFCQNWVHTPGATELGWPREKVRGGESGGKGTQVLFISFDSGLKCYTDREEADVP